MSKDYISDLNDIIYKFNPHNQKSTNSTDILRLSDATREIQIFGGIGSGKSSGSGEELRRAFLRANMGGVVFTAKMDEKDRWIKSAEKEKRENDLVFFEQGKPYRFNPLKYEL